VAKAVQQEGAPEGDRAAGAAPPLDGSLALELINTEVMERGKRHDVLTTPEVLARWWAEVCELYPEQCAVEGALAPTAWTSQQLDAVKALRMALRRFITCVVEQHAVEEEDLQPLNAILALGYSALERTGQGDLKTVMHVHDPKKGRVLYPIAVSALRLFTESDWRRLHQCSNDRCIVFFYDTTKSATRRWCSPGCMNRARSIQHYHLAKNKAAPA
jgi:predicted RNA-binding Zn ribbon-like protein